MPKHDYASSTSVHDTQAERLKGFVAAIALFKQASETTAVPVQHNTVQTTKVVCHDPWVSFVLTLLTI